MLSRGLEPLREPRSRRAPGPAFRLVALFVVRPVANVRDPHPGSPEDAGQRQGAQRAHLGPLARPRATTPPPRGDIVYAPPLRGEVVLTARVSWRGRQQPR
eukprot:1061324-Prymnesium_polylepis.1